MSLYLIHEPLVYWLKLIIYGKVAWIDGKKPGIKLPLWGIPIHLLISLIFGVLITLYLGISSFQSKKESLLELMSQLILYFFQP